MSSKLYYKRLFMYLIYCWNVLTLLFFLFFFPINFESYQFPCLLHGVKLNRAQPVQNTWKKKKTYFQEVHLIQFCNLYEWSIKLYECKISFTEPSHYAFAALRPCNFPFKLLFHFHFYSNYLSVLFRAIKLLNFIQSKSLFDTFN